MAKRSRFKRPPRTADLTLFEDPNDAEKAGVLHGDVYVAQAALRDLDQDDETREAAQAKVDAAEAARDEFVAAARKLTLTVKAVRPDEYEDLEFESRPGPKKRDRYKAEHGEDLPPGAVDRDVFYPKLLAASVTHVEWSDGETADGIDREEAVELWRNSNLGDQRLLRAALDALQTVSAQVPDLGKG